MKPDQFSEGLEWNRGRGVAYTHGLRADTLLSRADALILGCPVYRHGRPCIYGHGGFRFVSNPGVCVDCYKNKYIYKYL